MASQPQYTRGQLRDLLVEFYSRVDPARLDAGIDINGMIDWITYNGINDMNMRLTAKYGTGFKFEILNEQKERGQMSAMHRISMMPNTQLMEQQSKRLDLRTQVEAFYKQHDPNKLKTLDTFVEWIEVNGIKAFNDLLMKKYGVCIPDEAKPPSAPVPRAVPPPAAAAPPAPPSRGPAPPPPAPKVDQKKVLLGLLNRFYAIHEPDQEQDNDPIATWGVQVGMVQLNEKLMQLYGHSLETLDEDEQKFKDGTLHLPPPGDEAYEEDVPPPPEDDEEPPPAYEEPPPPPSPPSPPMAPPSVPPPLPPPQPSAQRPLPVPPPPKPVPPPMPAIVAEPPPRPSPPPAPPTPPAMPDAPRGPGLPPPPVNAGLKPPPQAPKPPALPKLPTLDAINGARPMPPAANIPRPAPPSAPAAPLPPNATPAQVAAQKAATKAPPPQQRKRRPSEGACDKYVLDLSGDGFGICLCGFNRAAHGQPKIAPNRRSVKVKEDRIMADKPCDVYRVDVQGKNFGDCLCGWAKDKHASMGSDRNLPTSPTAGGGMTKQGSFLSKPVPPKPPVPPAGIVIAPVSPKKADDGLMEVLFDIQTSTIFQMMKMSYITQHSAEPDLDTQVQWATNLLSLNKSPAQPMPGCLTLKVKRQ